MARTPKHYHHGRSPAAWVGSIGSSIGFVLAAAGAIMGPNWAIAITGGALILVACLTTMVMKVMGYGQP
ncbi:MAG: HGxxPAAW family protein [Arachnia sp.]